MWLGRKALSDFLFSLHNLVQQRGYGLQQIPNLAHPTRNPWTSNQLSFSINPFVSRRISKLFDQIRRNFSKQVGQNSSNSTFWQESFEWKIGWAWLVTQVNKTSAEAIGAHLGSFGAHQDKKWRAFLKWKSSASLSVIFDEAPVRFFFQMTQKKYFTRLRRFSTKLIHAFAQIELKRPLWPIGKAWNLLGTYPGDRGEA